MRLIFIILAMFATSPAFAQGWEPYDNARFGYSIDIPLDFYGQGKSDNGDGQAFVAVGKPTDLLVWGGYAPDGFEAEVDQRIAWDADEAWNVTYQATTPRWASWSAIKVSRILYQRMVLLCDGSSYAAFRAEYSVADRAEMDPIIERLVESLRSNC